jgi:geranylgeranyl diphosphate synthase type I
MPVSDGPAILGRYRDAIERALQQAIGGGTSPIEDAARYVMGWEDGEGRPLSSSGKRIRPALCLFAAEAFGANPADALPGAVAIELVHNFSLVHDEIQDHDLVRHNQPTTFARLGEAQAINVGDFLYTRAIAALTRGPGEVSRRMDALDILNDAIERMIRGQWEDLAFETRERVEVTEYLAMVAGKTGALLAAPVEIGAILAGASPESARTAGAWGERVGAAFQARDDYLGIWGDPEVTGKSNTNDISRKKKTLPVVHALNHPVAGPILRAAYAKPAVEPADVPGVVSALEAAGSADYCRERAATQAAEADRLLEMLPLDETARAEFRAIARYLVERDA